MMKGLKHKSRTQLRRERQSNKRSMKGLASSVKSDKRKKAMKDSV
jgi:DNA polymerase elongation subunit (family B)